jgi:hypothetical protein
MSKAGEFGKWAEKEILHRYGYVLDAKQGKKYYRGREVQGVEISLPRGVRGFLSFRGEYVFLDVHDIYGNDSGIENFLDEKVRTDSIVPAKQKKSALKRLERLDKGEEESIETELVCRILVPGSPDNVLFKDILEYMVVPVFKYEKH